VETSPRSLELIRAEHLTLRWDRSLTEPYRARFEGRPPRILESADGVTLEYPRFAVGRRRALPSTVTLNAWAPWQIETRGKLRGLTADLGGIVLKGFHVHDGAAELRVTLPRPAGEVPIEVSAGVVDTVFSRPVGVAARVHVLAGAAGLALDDQRFKAVGGGVDWQTPGWDRASDRYDITIRRGAKDLTLETVVAPHGSTGRTGRALATVVFTDIVESTERARESGDRQWRELLDRHDAVASRLAAAVRGEVVKTTGDGVLAVFDRPGDAVEFARSFREEIRGLGLDIRAGLHSGEVEFRGTDVGGIGVHIASRVMATAGPGEILVSRTVRDLVAGSDLDLEDRGTHALRGVGGEWQVFAVR
jgi:class 3 adenylate cyclase